MKMIRISDVSLVVTKGTTPTSVGLSYSNSGIPFLRSEDVVGSAIDLNKVRMFIDEDAHKRLERSALLYGDVLVTIAGTIGRVGFIGGRELAANCNQAVAFIRPDLSRIDPEWLCLLLQSPIYQAGFSEFVTGGAIPNVNLGQVASIEIPNIGIEAQRRIAARLKAQLAEVETARQATETQLRELRRLKTQALDKIFSEIKQTCPIGEAAKVQSGYAFKSQSFASEGIRLLRNANILPGKVYWDDVVFLGDANAKSFPNYELHEGDVLISLDRPIISSGIKVARVTEADLPSLLLQRVGRFLIDQKLLVPDYLYAFLQTDMFIDEVSGHAQSLGVPHISLGQIENIEMPMPDIFKQKTLAAVMKEVDLELRSARQAAETQLAELNLLPQKILAAAFEGAE
jgi:type I restriction enzyme S subunit